LAVRIFRSQPQLRFGIPAKLTEAAMSLEERLLHDICWVYLALKAPANLQPGEQGQVVAVELKKAPQS
jgi:hypothetical protein